MKSMHFEWSYIKSCNSFGFVVWITKFQCDAWIVNADLKIISVNLVQLIDWKIPNIIKYVCVSKHKISSALETIPKVARKKNNVIYR